MENLLRKIEKIIPKAIYRFFQPAYHRLLSIAGAIRYSFPAKDLKIIGVTGTKGKSTTVEILNSILKNAGYKTAITSTIHFQIGDVEKPNLYKMSMPGRFFMQNFLHKAKEAKCDFVILEMTSEGAKFFRHKYIPLDALIFTNLAPEHIESHGSFEKYREAKLSLVDNLKDKKGFLVVNSDDENSEYFLKRHNGNGKKFSFKLNDAVSMKVNREIELRFGDITIYSKLHGEFNVLNILAAATCAKELGISDEDIKKGVESLEVVKGRAEYIREGQNFDVVVDYAHTPDSLLALYKSFEGQRKICVLGATGGGRDKWKRPAMAKVANDFCDQIILTNDDPYDEDPMQIVNDMKTEVSEEKLQIIIDRKKAIEKAVSMAKENDAVLITGKGTDPFLMESNGKKTPWSDARFARDAIKEN